MNQATLSHLEKVKMRESGAILLLRFVHATGTPLFLYLQTDYTGYQSLQRAYEKGETVNFADYGKLILFGENEPDADTKEFIAALEV